MPSMTRTLSVLVPLGVLLLPGLGCAPGGTGAPSIPGPVRELADFHAGVRAEGLDERRFDQRAYREVVEPLIRGSDRLRSEVVGTSAEGREIRSVRFGSGPATVLLWSQMHGDESTATMALADVLRMVAARPEHPVVRTILEGATVHVVPMLNPDGAQRFQRRNAQGVDINRDARELATPEAKTLKAVRDRVEPDFGFNLHDQSVGTRVGDSDRGVAIALLSPPFDETREVNDVRRRAMEVSGVIRTAIEPLVGGHIARYDDTFNPRAFGDLMTRWGASTILIESGGWEDDPQKQYLRRVNFVAILAALESIATGSYEGVGTELYASLPENGRRVGDLLVLGGTLSVPGLPPLPADLLIDYERPLLEEGGVIADIGDLRSYEARDTIRVDGLHVVPSESALDFEYGAQIQPGAPADFVVSRSADGSNPLWRFEGGPPPAAARR